MERVKAELVKVERQVNQFLDRIADASVPSVIAAYESRIKVLEDRKIGLVEKIGATGRPARSFDETLRTALQVLVSYGILIVLKISARCSNWLLPTGWFTKETRILEPLIFLCPLRP